MFIHMLFILEEELEELINKAKNGDKEAFIECVKLVQNYLFNIAYMKLNNIEDANDVIQETMLNAFKNISNLREPKYFKTWIIRILINECNRFYKEKYKRINLFNKIIRRSDANEIDWSINTVEDKLDSKMDYDLMIKELNPNEQNIIILYFGNRFSKKEIADILNISINTVKTRLRRAEEKIRKKRKEG